MIKDLREQILREKLKDRPNFKLIQKLQQLYDEASKSVSKKI
jgi:hypothetical protein|tara:strand:- start:259 stop:384 length:126 start_codon:yes stop_codon:yes gene_type:complete